MTKSTTNGGSPGSHPHADQPNWRPGDTIEAYLHNCREGLETFSERRLARLIGWSRAGIWRAKGVADIPADLFEELLETADPVPSIKQLAAIGRALSSGAFEAVGEAECCPHCGGLLRSRAPWSESADKVVRAWLNAEPERTTGKPG